MPSIKDFDKRKKKGHKKTNSIHSVKSEPEDKPPEAGFSSEYDVELKSSSDEIKGSTKTQQRRPGKIDESEQDQMAKEDSTVGPESFQSFSDPEPFELQFPGSHLLKEKAPKAFGLAERIAGDWINDGRFEALPVGNPLAQILASKALLKAKNLEKNMLNSTPIALAKIGLEYAKSKIKR